MKAAVSEFMLAIINAIHFPAGAKYRMADDCLPTLWRAGFLRAPAGEEWAKKKPIEAVVAAVRRAQAARTPVGKVVVVKAMTASGKSTLIPPRIWREFAMARPAGPEWSARSPAA